MRLGDLCFLLIPPPVGLGAFLAQHEWIAVILVAAALTMLGLLVRFANIIFREFAEKGYWSWREERENFLDSQVVHDESRRMRKLEGERRRREFKHESPSWWDQLKLFR